jgi:hypothetical protein
MLHRKFDLFLGWHSLVLLLGLHSLVIYISYVDRINQRGSLSILFFSICSNGFLNCGFRHLAESYRNRPSLELIHQLARSRPDSAIQLVNSDESQTDSNPNWIRIQIQVLNRMQISRLDPEALNRIHTGEFGTSELCPDR